MDRRRIEYDCYSSKLNVYVLAVSQMLPSEDATDAEASVWSKKLLTPLRKIRNSAEVVYAGEEITDNVSYRREWAILTSLAAMELLAYLNSDIFTLRQVVTSEVFLSKFQDLRLFSNRIEEYTLGTLDKVS